MIAEKTYSRGGNTYIIRHVGGFKAAELTTCVINMAGDLAPLLLALKKGGVGDIDVATINIDWKKLQPMLEAFAEVCTLKGAKETISLGDSEVFDQHFGGDLDGIFELFLQSLEFNFSDFLEKRFGITPQGIRDAIEAAMKEESQSSSPSASTDTAGESSDPTSAAD